LANQSKHRLIAAAISIETVLHGNEAPVLTVELRCG
jgi:hypothetical protein